MHVVLFLPLPASWPLIKIGARLTGQANLITIACSVALRRSALQTTLTDACSVALRRSVLQTTLSEQQRPTTGCRLEDTRPSDANINVLSQFAVGSLGRVWSGALHIQLHSIELKACSE